MRSEIPITRRSCLALAAASLASLRAGGKRIPIGLEISSVRNELNLDPIGTIRAVSKMGYESIEFWMPYVYWTGKFAKDVRKLLDEVHLPCYSTLADASYFSRDKLQGIIDLNQSLGSKLMVMTDPEVNSFDEWKGVAERLNHVAEKLRPLGMRVGYHNHEVEFTPVDGRVPMDVLAKNTSKDVVLQLDTGNCLQGGGDPVAWMEKNPGRTVSMHCKDWHKAPWPQCYFVNFGEGLVPWKKLFQVAERTGGIEYYLIEQGNGPGGKPPTENVARYLATFRKLHGDA